MWDPQKNYEYFNHELAFPSILDYGWPKVFRSLLHPFALAEPVDWLIKYLVRMNDTKSWSETGLRVIGSFTSSLSSGIEYMLKPKAHSSSTYISKKFFDRNGKLRKDVNPAPAITHLWELKNAQMHGELLKNNGTVGVQVYG